MPPQISQSEKPMWSFSFSGMSLETANWLSDIANIVFIGSLIAGLLATFVVVRTSSVKETYWDKAREEAQAELVKANRAIAEANAIAAQANEKAEAERLARVKIEQQIAPRRLLDEQKGKLREVLSKTPGYKIFACSRMLDPEGADFLSDFSETINSSGWTVQFTNHWTQMLRGIFVGRVDFADLPGEKELKAAFAAADLPLGFLSLNANDGAVPGGFQPGVLYLLIGGKAP